MFSAELLYRIRNDLPTPATISALGLQGAALQIEC